MQAINRGDVESLLALYVEKAVVIPTFSNRLLNSLEKVSEYFQKLGSREELSITLN
jgi:hypothetical protein